MFLPLPPIRPVLARLAELNPNKMSPLAKPVDAIMAAEPVASSSCAMEEATMDSASDGPSSEHVDADGFWADEQPPISIIGDIPPDIAAAHSGAAVMAAFSATFLPDGNIEGYAQQAIYAQGLDDTFYILDLGLLERLFEAWCRLLPRVQPMYAVKCLPDKATVALLAALGAGFDCASRVCFG